MGIFGKLFGKKQEKSKEKPTKLSVEEGQNAETVNEIEQIESEHAQLLSKSRRLREVAKQIMSKHDKSTEELLIGRIDNTINKFKTAEEESDRELEELRDKNRQWSIKFSYIGELHNNAQILEKEGNLHEAIDAYLKAVEFGKSQLHYGNYARDIDRLVILYRKTKQYQKEADVITFALSHYNDGDYKRIKYQERLEKVNQIINKNSKI